MNLHSDESTKKKQITLKVVLYGPSGAGKTSLLRLIKTLDSKRALSTLPSITVEKEVKNLLIAKIIFFALPGQIRYLLNKELLMKYLLKANILFYVIDSADTSRFELAKMLLAKTISLLNLLNRQIPIFILANKQDLPNALPVDIIREKIWSFLEKQLPRIRVRFFGVSVLNPTSIIYVINECIKLYLEEMKKHSCLSIHEVINADDIVIFDHEGFPVFFSNSEENAFSLIGLTLDLLNLLRRELGKDLHNGMGIIQVEKETFAFLRKKVSNDYIITIAIKNFRGDIRRLISILPSLPDILVRLL